MTQDRSFRDEVAAPVAGNPPDSLRRALRRARADDAERSGAVAELRAARIGRLELLQDALQPLLAQVPADVDMFDVALVPSTDPRLFIDMIGHVGMGRDAHLYRFQQDTRHGRILIAESESVDAMVDAVTVYVARRLLERDKALASDAYPAAVRDERRADRPDNGPDVEAAGRGKARRVSRATRWVAIAFAFLIDLLGAIVFLTLLGAAGWYVWERVHGAM